MEHNPLDSARRLGKLVGCSTHTSSKLVDCLRNVPAETLINAILDAKNGLFTFPFKFNPSHDLDFIRWTSADINTCLAHKTCHSKYPEQSEIDMMVGITADEGNLALAPLFGGHTQAMGNFNPNFFTFKNEIVPFFLGQQRMDGSEFINTLITHEYLSNNHTEMSNLKGAFLDMFADCAMLEPMYRTLDLHQMASNRKSYMYIFAEDCDDHPFVSAPWWKGAGHGDELPFLFGFRTPEVGRKEHCYHGDGGWKSELAARMMTFWSNFAKTG